MAVLERLKNYCSRCSAKSEERSTAVYIEHTSGVAAAGSTAEGSPEGASLAGASELLLEDASTGATRFRSTRNF